MLIILTQIVIKNVSRNLTWEFKVDHCLKDVTQNSPVHPAVIQNVLSSLSSWAEEK